MALSIKKARNQLGNRIEHQQVQNRRRIRPQNRYEPKQVQKIPWNRIPSNQEHNSIELVPNLELANTQKMNKQHKKSNQKQTSNKIKFQLSGNYS